MTILGWVNPLPPNQLGWDIPPKPKLVSAYRTSICVPRCLDHLFCQLYKHSAAAGLVMMSDKRSKVQYIYLERVRLVRS